MLLKEKKKEDFLEAFFRQEKKGVGVIN